MIAWSDPGPAFAVPAGAVDIYQSIQRLEPGAWVAAHTHEGPESGVVIAGAIARHENAATRTFATGETFCTPGGSVHATGNPGSHVAEAITLHVVTAGSPFSTPCACATAPPPHPGSSNPARSIVRDIRFSASRVCARHARVAVSAPIALAPQGALPIVLRVLTGRVSIARTLLESPAFIVVDTEETVAPQGATAELLVTRFADGRA